ncbi:sulfotransferase [Euzebya tangerina]|uniref:sulfotransferase n=1 Tax=Euzebya tangerina TaxID=591198 RepID=UPI000E30B9A8|nr:sulfotransferase [Euzebya tangerina]
MGEWPGDLRATDAGPVGVAPPTPVHRRVAKRLLRAAVDRGLPGTTPLDAHLVICGFPRSGSTLLQLVVDACVHDVCSFVGEVEARWAAQFANRNHRWLLTKRPADITAVDDVRCWYTRNPGRAVFLVTVRDPREVLTSTHKGYPPSRGYYCEIERWQDVHRRIRAIEADPDVVVVSYEELTGQPSDVEARLGAELGWSLSIPFERFHERARASTELPAIDVGALGGVRPLQPPPTGRWAAASHRERMREVVRRAPEVLSACRHWGYTTDDHWAEQL